MTNDQSTRTKQWFLTSTRHYSKATFQLISFVEGFASMVQIYRFLFKSIPILLCQNKCTTFTLLQLENIYTSYSFLNFTLGRHHSFTAWGVRLLIFSLFFSHFINTFTEDHQQTISEFPKRVCLLILPPQQTEFHFKILSNL